MGLVTPRASAAVAMTERATDAESYGDAAGRFRPFGRQDLGRWSKFLAPSESRHRLAHIEYLRGLAALAVMWFHFTAANEDFPPGLIKLSGTYGFLGVDIFFVISGFIIPYAMMASGYRIRTDGSKFFLARIVRLELPYLASVALCVALPFLAHLTPWSQGDLPSNMLRDVLLHPAYIVPWVEGAQWLNAAYWTLAIEFQFYILMLFAAPLLIGGSRWGARLFLLAACAAAYINSDPRLLFCYLPLFGFGFAAFLCLHRRLHWLEAVLWMGAFSMACTRALGPDDALAGLLAAIMIAVPWPRGLRLLSALGVLSYSLYLVHNPIAGRVFTLVERLPDQPAIKIAGIAIAVVASLVAAFLFHVAIEAPSMSGSKKVRATGLWNRSPPAVRVAMGRGT